MLKKDKFEELFGCYSTELQEWIINQLYDLEHDELLGLGRMETIALRDYLGGVAHKNKWYYRLCEMYEIPPMAKVSRKLMAGVMSQKYLLDIDEATRELSKMMDVSDVKQLNVVSKYTTGELMNMYGVASYPLLQLAKKHNIFPLPDLAPDGAIRPFIDVANAGFSAYLANSLLRASLYYGRAPRRRGYRANVSNVLVMDEDQLLKTRNVGKNRIEEVSKLRKIVEICYPEHYKRLVELKDYAEQGSYFEPGSREDFEEFRKECELRKLISFDDESCLMRIEDYTPSELRSMFGELYDVLEIKCKGFGVYPLPEFDADGDVTRKYMISSVSNMGFYSFNKRAEDVKYVHQLFELNDEEMGEWLDSLGSEYRETAEAFVENVRCRYPNHIAKLKKERAKRCCQKRIDG